MGAKTPSPPAEVELCFFNIALERHDEAEALQDFDALKEPFETRFFAEGFTRFPLAFRGGLPEKRCRLRAHADIPALLGAREGVHEGPKGRLGLRGESFPPEDKFSFDRSEKRVSEARKASQGERIVKISHQHSPAKSWSSRLMTAGLTGSNTMPCG